MADYAYPKALTGMQDVQWSTLMASIVDDGAVTLESFAPSANGSGMRVTLAPGRAMIQGVLGGDDSAAQVTIAAAPASGQERIDIIVKRLNRGATPVIQTAVVSGTPAATDAAVAPRLTQNVGGVWEWPVASVIVRGGAVSISADRVIDRRTFTGTNVRRWLTAPDPKTVPKGTLGQDLNTGAWKSSDGTRWVDLVPVLTAADLPVVPTDKGGTGATSANAGRDNLGIRVQTSDPGHADGRVWIKG